LRLPPWLGAEVTGNPRYYNNRLAQEPFAGAPGRETGAGKP
jgi:CYTH domain-containing protein